MKALVIHFHDSFSSDKNFFNNLETTPSGKIFNLDLTLKVSLQKFYLILKYKGSTKLQRLVAKVTRSQDWKTQNENKKDHCCQALRQADK